MYQKELGGQGETSTNYIVIGAGTTGARFVDNIAATLKLYGLGKIQANESFIVMDSNLDELAKLQNIDENDKIKIQKERTNVLKVNDPDFPSDIRIAGGGGAGLIRRAGLAFYRFNRVTIQNKIKAVGRDLKIRTNATHYQIVLVSSLFGGTGSSFLVELGLDIHNWLGDLATQVSFTAIGILPHLVASNDLHCANAMATLKEVDFIRSITDPVIVGDRQYLNPFDFFFVVDTEKTGARIDSDVEKAVARLLIDLGFIPFKESDDRKPGSVDWADLIQYTRDNPNELSSFCTYSVTLPIFEVKWIIKTEAAIGKDDTTLKQLQTSIEKGEQQLTSIRNDVAEYSKVARDYGQRINLLSQELAKGYPKLRRELEDSQQVVDNCRQELTASEKKLTDTENKLPKQSLQDAARLLEEQSKITNSLKEDLSEPKANDYEKRLPVSSKEIEVLRQQYAILDNMNLEKVSRLLGKADTFRAHVLGPVEDRSLISQQRALLNYEFEPQSNDKGLETETARVLQSWGKAEMDRETGIPRMMRHKVGCAYLISSSHQENIELLEVRNSMGPMEAHARSIISHKAETKSIKSQNMWKYSVHFYSLLLGIPLYENDPRKPPRMQDLVTLSKAYDEIKGNLVDIIGAHAFLFGYKDAFEKLTGISLGGMSSEERNRRIAEFWANYEIVDPRTKIDQLYVTLATTIGRLQSRGTEIEGIVNLVTTQCSQQIPKQHGLINLTSVLSDASILADNLRKLDEILNELGEFSLEFANIIQNSARILPMAKQRIREQMNQARHILKCTEETLKATSGVTFTLGTKSEAFSNTLNKWLANLQNYLGKTPPNKMEIQNMVQQISQAYTDVRDWLLRSSKTSQQVLPNLQRLKQSLDDLRQEILRMQ